MKVLNLYAGIGGNRTLWPKNIKVTAIEYKKDIADIYKERFCDDEVIVTDAHNFLLDNYKEFDFIWSSPPCPTHSRFNLPLENKRYPDMKLYEEIIFLKHFFDGKFCVENVISYYDPLIKPILMDGHFFWTNFIVDNNGNIRNYTNMSIEEIAKERLIDLEYLKKLSKDYELLLRNCVLPKTGLHIFNMAFKTKQVKLNELSSM